MLLQIAMQDGKDPSQIKIRLNVTDQDGNPVEREMSLAQMESAAKPLEEEATACVACSANFLDQPYGCFGVINYPVSSPAENWLLGRVQPYGTIGATLCLQFMSEFGVSGDSIAQMRQSGFFENANALEIIQESGVPKSLSVTADQLLETIFMAGEVLNPGHCFGILLWLGAIKVDGKVPGGLEDRAMLQKLMSLKSRDEKVQHAELELGPHSNSDEAKVFQRLVKALYLSWLHNVPVLMSA